MKLRFAVKTWGMKTHSKTIFNPGSVVPPTMRILTFPPSFGSPTLALGSLVYICLLLLLGVDSNRCVTSGTYLITTGGKKIINKPEKFPLKEVESKMCGFKISATEISGSNNDKWVFTFVAVKVENTTQEFCSFWYYHAICVCAFHGCNSVTGTLLETLFKVYNKESQILGEDYSSAVSSEPRRVNSAIFVMGLVTDYYDGKLPSITEEWFNDMSRGGGDFKEHRKHHPHEYPNQTRVEELILEGHNLYSTTTTTTTTSTTTTSITTLTTSTTPLTTSQSSNSLNDPNDSSKKRLVKVTGGMIIVLVVIVISLVIFIIVALVIVRKKLKKTLVRSKKKTKRVTKTGDTENPKTVPALPSSEPSPKTDRTETGELSIRPADDMDTINACQSNWSTMGGLTNVTQLTKF